MSDLLARAARAELAHSARRSFRKRRFEFFQSLMSTIRPDARILDVGGTPEFWHDMRDGGSDAWNVVVLNTYPTEAYDPGLSAVVGDCRAMPEFGAGEFDVVFSNSVIEHVGGPQDQKAMASEICRVGTRYFVQTPNLFFPMEPHFCVPLFQFMPKPVRIRLAMRFALGMFNRRGTRREAEALIGSVRLLTERQMRGLFHGCSIYRERILGLTKSLVAYGGWTIG